MNADANTALQTGIVDRLLSLLTHDVLVLIAFIAVGVVWSIAWTQWRKPAIKDVGLHWRTQRARIRAEAFFAAAIPTAIMVGVFAPTTARATVALVLIEAPLAGMLSPLGWYLWAEWAWPMVRRRVDRRSDRRRG